MRTRLAYLGLAAALVACSSSGSQPGDAGTSSSDAETDGPATTLCSTDPRAQTFAPGMVQAGTRGVLAVQLVTATPSPPAKGDNAWRIAVADAAGNPVDGLGVTVKTWMPDHLHGSSITPQIAPLGGGRYDVTLLNLFMPGIWTITFSLASTPDAATTTGDSAVFTFCVPG